MQISHLPGPIGAEITDIDVRLLDAETFRPIHQAFLDRLVLVVRDQTLSIEDFLNYSARFGVLRPHIVRKSRHPQFPAMMVMDNRVESTSRGVEAASKPVLVKRGAVWHTDGSYEVVAPIATQLHAEAIPSRGGDTLFASLYDAYDRLPESLKQRIEGRSASYRYGGKLRRQLELLDEGDRNRPPAIHPLVQTHPETGRRTLYFNPGQVLEIIGLEPAESEAIIAALTAATESPDGDYRHKWRLGDLVIWDNRCSLHSATGDYPPEERRAFKRTTIVAKDAQEKAA